MSRRKLSHQQARRVRSLQDTRADTARDGSDAAGERFGIVVSRLGKQADVEDTARPGMILRCHLRANLGSIVAGDRVVWRADDDTGVIVARMDRKSVLRRPDMLGKPRAVAANLDQILIVLAPEPEPFPNLIDRYLVAAEDAGIRALLVLNKIDLLRDVDSAFTDLLARYAAIGYTSIGISTRRADGLAALAPVLAGQTTAIVGQSGVGKSSLVAALLPAESVRVGALSASESKGRHTTSAARLYHLPGGGDLIDSPGIRDFSLSHIDAGRTAHGFVEFRPFLGRCRFRDCRHRDEPGCALREALEAGSVSAERYGSYRQIVDGP